jgi:hypothetical protein
VVAAATIMSQLLLGFDLRKGRAQQPLVTNS